MPYYYVQVRVFCCIIAPVYIYVANVYIYICGCAGVAEEERRYA